MPITNNQYFITETYIKENTILNQNVDVNDILPLVKNAADMWTRSTLGTYFYNIILDAYNQHTLTTDQVTLVEFMQPSIAWRATADAVIELSYQIKNKGIQIQTGDFSASPEYKAIMWMSEHYTQKAEFYENRLGIYLWENKELYPDFLNVLNKDSILKYRNNRDNPNFNKRIMFV